VHVKWLPFTLQEGLMQTSSLAEMNLLFLSFMFVGLWLKVLQKPKLIKSNTILPTFLVRKLPDQERRERQAEKAGKFWCLPSLS